MNSKERVYAAFRRDKLPDRVPVQFDLSRALAEQFAAKYGMKPDYTTSYYEDVTYRLSNNDLRVKMGSDCVIVGASLPRGYEHPADEGGTFTNEFGMTMKQGLVYMDIVKHPLAHVTTAAEIEHYQMPDPLADGRYDDAMRDIAKYKDTHFIVGDMELSMFDMMQQMLGLEKLLMDLAEGLEYLEPLMDKCRIFATEIGKKLITLGVDAVWAGDDFGAQNGMIISPRMWRRYFKERYRQMYADLKAVNPNIIICQHCDGAVAPILGDWIDVGLEVFNPVQPNVPGHEPEELKAKFGDRMSFWGAIDQQKLLPFGTAEEIEADVRAKIEALGRGGGYMVSPAHVIQGDTSMENVEAMIDAVRKHGVYS
jgi:uroporphyrinogen decarboxylase